MFDILNLKINEINLKVWNLLSIIPINKKIQEDILNYFNNMNEDDDGYIKHNKMDNEE